jgi:hypothetical protein
MPSLPRSCKRLEAAIDGPAALTPEKGHFSYPYDMPMMEQRGTAVFVPTGTTAVAPTEENVSPGITLHSACSAVDVLAAPPTAKPHGTPLMTELLPEELSVAMTLQGCGMEVADSSSGSPTSAGASPILESGDSSPSSEGVENSEQSEPFTQKEELAALRESLAELYASIAEQAGDKHCETLFDIAAVSVLERGLLALERVWVSEGLSCA